MFRLQKLSLLSCLTLFVFTAQAQNTTKDSLVIQAYMEAHISWTPSNNSLKERPGFIYNYSTQNEPAFNLAALRFQYERQRFRTSAAVITGTYPKRNLAQEKQWARHIGEAYAGFRLSRKQQLWVDAGVFPSHIGAESYIGKENVAATRALISDQTPYYETGIRVSYRPSEKWFLSMLALNGWQRISAPIDQLGANWGMQIQFTPTDRILLNNSSFIGQVKQGSDYRTRIYSNSYATFSLHKNDQLQVGWDIGFQDRLGLKGVYVWNAFLAQYRHTFTGKKWAALVRAEKIADPHNVLYQDPAGQQFILNHLSAGIDWNPDKRILLRLEWNHQFSRQKLFSEDGLSVRRLSGWYLIACIDVKKVFRRT